MGLHRSSLEQGVWDIIQDDKIVVVFDDCVSRFQVEPDTRRIVGDRKHYHSIARSVYWRPEDVFI